ncbi:hypothetical protein A3K01_02925 [candidate division WWE3 bacterium RIFOXYD1_FULL_43_17]|uniref:Uncharacterized protein n=3 Tax=Katanobacteria TaxID=422282 RepID=A0A1F4XBA6_UNCKA|nr:MAG: hypothetical protein UU59_C0014G0015 [candidate division WWE3 bacterium GW2011_GWE1_41_27]KKS59392.1 MAG: hypothetical protein UV26_C0024G0018 [candidate division WWE3 bacterium GW2011_GWF2_42_42]OGC78956.1 MAG: hypothetical protein A3K01_02925 [candidate division WWE3 bacterium RIFOXYD1_FULL_43_17]
MKGLEELLSKKMTRREFLLYFGTLIVAIVGIPGILNKIENVFLGKKINGDTSTNFGGGPYGGTKKGMS